MKLWLPFLFLAFLWGCPGELVDPETPDLGTTPDTATCPGELDCACDAQNPCGAGLVCDAGTCQTCAPGQEGCACDTVGVCDVDLVCEGDVCVPCPQGTLGCSCGDGCGSGLACDLGVCEECPIGSLGCACTGGGACDGDNTCLNDVCVEGGCEPGEPGCMCRTGDVCDVGARCRQGVCTTCDPRGGQGCGCDAQNACLGALECNDDGVCAACTGAEGCVCDDATPCDSGLACQAGVCATCTPGEQGCSCDDQGACTDGSICSEDECKPCAPDFIGQPGCPCAAGMMCEGGLACQVGTCEPCPLGSDACPCDMGACDDNLVCNGGGTCQACTPGSLDCTCDAGGTCSGGGVCDVGNNRCRVALECTTDVTCLPNQLCQPASGGQDAVCLQDCEVGWQWNAAMGACEMVDVNCDSTPGAQNSIFQMCETQNRRCVETMNSAMCTTCKDFFTDDGGTCRGVETCATLSCTGRTCTPETSTSDATCDPCPMGFIEDSPTVCRVRTCADLMGMCQAGQTCIEAVGTTPAFCSSSACPSGPQALCQNQLGFTGSFFPDQADGVCVCDTEEGYFNSNNVAKDCDDDSDGFVTEEAYGSLTSAIPAIRAVTRCTVRYVNEVELRHETGGGDRMGTGATRPRVITLPSPLPLFESIPNDTQGLAYNASRVMSARERNSFTRACAPDPMNAGRSADFNGNTVPDARESQGQALTGLGTARSLPPALLAAYETYAQYAYFTELYEGWFDRVSGPVGGQEFGVWVIRERQRQAAPVGREVPLSYDVGSYWTQCRRKADALSTSATHRIGMDFVDQGDDPNNPSWPGLFHASQFKCVEVVTNSNYGDQIFTGTATPGVDAPHFVTPEILADAGAPGGAIRMKGEFHTCDLNAEVAVTRNAIDNPHDPDYSCTRSAGATPGQVGWAAIEYMDYPTSDAYLRGCISECAESAQVCSGLSEGSPDGGRPVCSVREQDFGRGARICGGVVLSYSPTDPTDGRGFTETGSGNVRYTIDAHVPLIPSGQRVTGTNGTSTYTLGVSPSIP